MKTLRAFLAESLSDVDPTEKLGPQSRSHIVGQHAMAVRDWLAQPEVVVLIENGIVETGSTAGAALALRREAVK